MHFLIYIPGPLTGGSQPLIDAGLSDLTDRAMSLALHVGPDGGAGTLYAWPGASGRLHMEYAPQRQTWIPAVQSGARAAGRYWVGLSTDAPPCPSDLVRPVTFAGVSVTIDRFEWSLPSADHLPAVVTRRDDGRCQLQYLDFDEFLTTAKYLQLKLLKLQEGDGIDYTELMDFVEGALRCNYRYVPEIGSHLQWWSAGEQGTLVQALFAILPQRLLSREVSDV